MTPAAALAELRAAGVRVGLRADGTVSLDAAAPPLPELLDAARRHRDEIAGLLRAESGPPTEGQVSLPASGLAGMVGPAAEINETHGSGQVPGRSGRSVQWIEGEPEQWVDLGRELTWADVPTEAAVAGLLAGYHRHCRGKP